MTGVLLERTPNHYVIRVMKRGKCIDWFTYHNINEMMGWFYCLPHMKYNKNITNHGSRLFRRVICRHKYEWELEDKYMAKAQRRYYDMICK